jgi:hypothetical protein
VRRFIRTSNGGLGRDRVLGLGLRLLALYHAGHATISRLRFQTVTLRLLAGRPACGSYLCAPDDLISIADVHVELMNAANSTGPDSPPPALLMIRTGTSRKRRLGSPFAWSCMMRFNQVLIKLDDLFYGSTLFPRVFKGCFNSVG